mmetsp:Transcript_48130/g.105055  ORF Transcript_48130/g.105055 Transcript_48130/m.105055 type:complete len:227 (-) Transcript_48130:243-923(-)
MTLVGPASWEVPVSTATRQSSQIVCILPSKVMSSICTSQYPAVPVTGTQKSSEAMWSSLTSPKVISDVSASESERNTEKIGFCNTECTDKRFIMLKLSPWAMLVKAKPSTPSKAKDAKGCLLSSVEEMKAPTEQALPTQMLSSRQRPVMCPVPKVIVISSGSMSDATSDPSQFRFLAVDDFCCMKRSCILHASLEQSSPGTIKFPLPVSKTTENSWAGVPTFKAPK